MDAVSQWLGFATPSRNVTESEGRLQPVAALREVGPRRLWMRVVVDILTVCS